MVFAFKERFVKPILEETKKHTIREDIHHRWKPGMTMHMATGVRTKKYKQFNLRICVSTQNIEILASEYMDLQRVRIEGGKLTIEELQQLAWNDGFDNVAEFFMWFADGFKGKIIHWTTLKY